MTKQEREDAIQNAIPRKPIKHELGGGFYYQCPWIKCNESLKRYYRYCPGCGQKLLWENDYDE